MTVSKPKAERKVDVFEETVDRNNLVRSFHEKCEKAISRIRDIDKFRSEDSMVDFVFQVGRKLFDTPLDQQDGDSLLRQGGKLAGAGLYLGQKWAMARGTKDVYTSKSNEVDKERYLELKSQGVKTNEARAQVVMETSGLREVVTEKEIESLQWENITDATQVMISFIQSAIKVKEGERFHGRKLADNS